MAKHVEIRLALEVVAPLVDFVLSLHDPARGALPTAPNLKLIDKEMREIWLDDLVASHETDMAVFHRLFDEKFHSTGIIEFPEESCDAIVRACASARLTLRTKVLAGIPDEALETGGMDLKSLAGDEPTGFMAYVFLGSFQEILIRHMDPEIGMG